jgi:hypothetical protein
MSITSMKWVRSSGSMTIAVRPLSAKTTANGRSGVDGLFQFPLRANTFEVRIV